MKKIKFIYVTFGKQSLTFKDLSDWNKYFERFREILGDCGNINVYEATLIPIKLNY